VKVIVHNALSELGWNETFLRALNNLIAPSDNQLIGRVNRIDRGWSTFLCVPLGATHENESLREWRVRNIGADVAVGDWILVSEDGERILCVVPRQSRLVRRASSDAVRAEAQTIAANIDVVFLVHGLDTAPNERRLERELVLAFDSGARPVIVLTKSDTADANTALNSRDIVTGISTGVPVHVVSSVTGEGLDALRAYARNGETLAVLGASGVGKSTLINALTGTDSQDTGAIRVADKRGRHTTTAVDLVPLPEQGWLIDTPGVRAVSLWTSGHGIERAFADIFELAEQCKFRDCKHEAEPGCAVQAAIVVGALRAARLESMKRLVAEEAELEHEQQQRSRRDR
jgi:ribosome biogenesis GTPase